MPTSSDLNIAQAYASYLNKVCNQIITDCHITVIATDEPYFIVACYQNRAIRPLKLKPEGWLHLQQGVTIQSDAIIVEDYVYRYSFSPNPRDAQKWIFRYDYRLNPKDNYPHAHLHLNASRGDDSLNHIHFPTGGRVSIEQIIHHLIIEYGIEPRRTDWLGFLAESHRGFIERRNDPPLFP